MSSGEMSFREKCLIGRNVLGRNVLGRTVLGRNGFWGEMSCILLQHQAKGLPSIFLRKAAFFPRGPFVPLVRNSHMKSKDKGVDEWYN